MDYRFGVIAATLANVNRDPDKRREPYAPSDFFPSLKEEAKPQAPQSAEEMEQKLLGITRALRGKVVSRET